MIHPRIEKFIMKDKLTGCWNWLGALDQEGYAIVWWEGSKRVGRLLWLQNKGPIPFRNELHHTCENRRCVNYEAHLVPIPKRQHITTFHVEDKTHCSKGHELLVPNVYFVNGRKRCNQCNRDRANKYYRDKKNAVI